MRIADDGRNDTYEDGEGRQRVDYDNIRRSESRVNWRKWLASKLAPHIYVTVCQAWQSRTIFGTSGQAGPSMAFMAANGITPEELERIREAGKSAREAETD